MNRKVCLITGGTAGIGRETAAGIAKQGINVVIVSRDYLKGKEALEYIRRVSGNKRIGLLIADLSSQAQIHTLAEEFRKKYQHLDILINNAGVVMQKRVLTEERIEYTLAVNHFAPFLLTNLLIDLLIDNAPSRIVNVSSQTHWRTEINFRDLNSAENYNPTRVYAVTKLMNILFTYKLARMLRTTGVTVNCLHPGVVNTKLMNDYHGQSGFTRIISKLTNDSAEKGARTSIFLATSPDIERTTGKYFVDMQEKESSPQSYDTKTADRLWEVSSSLTGVIKPV